MAMCWSPPIRADPRRKDPYMRIWRMTVLAAIGTAAMISIWSCGSDNNTTDSPIASGDTTAPSIDSTSPANSDTGVSITPLVTVWFSEPLDTSAVRRGVMTIGTDSGQFAYTSTQFQLRPARLRGDSLYQVRIKGTIADTMGNVIGNDYIFSFRTTGSMRGNYSGYYTGIKYYLHPDSIPDTMVQAVKFSFGDDSYSIKTDTLRPPIDLTFNFGKGVGTYQLLPDTSFAAGSYQIDTEAGFTTLDPLWNIHGPVDTLVRFADGDSVMFIIHDPFNYRYKKLVLGRL